jgi:hypothetical protein
VSVRGLVCGLLLALLAAPAALAKENVRATLVGPVELDARPGERITIEWRLEDADGRPFGAGGLFVRLRSAAGGRPVTAVTDGSGRFAVRITVPEGGIGGIEFGVQGWRTVAGRSSRADVLFPLDNDPFAGSRARPARLSSAVPAGDDPQPPWLLVLFGAGAVGVITGACVRMRRVGAR